MCLFGTISNVLFSFDIILDKTGTSTMFLNVFTHGIVLFSVIQLSVGEILKCSSTTGRNNCQCFVKTDEMTFMPIVEARCQYLELQELPSLVTEHVINSLDVSHNDFEQLETGEKEPPFGATLQSLKFCHNSISDIDDDYFNFFPNLVTLDLSHNYLQVIKPKGMFEKLEKLQNLDLSYNEIEAVSEGIFESLYNLKTLDLSYNPLHQVLQEPMMSKLHLPENLHKLSIDNVGVSKIHAKYWHKFKSLQYLSVADNPIDAVPQTSQHTLQYLDISGTNITKINENDLKYTNLKTLKMSRMENLTSVSSYAFYNLGNLEELILTDSQSLDDFSGVAFGALDRNTYPRKLKKFELARNRLSSLNESYRFIFQEVEEADISFNPWKCNCGVLWIKEMDSIMRRKYDIRCSSPNDLTNNLVVSLEPTDVPNCFPEIYGKKSHQTALLILLMIVFALIVVIVYLCLYSPSWSIKIGSSKMSPDSPYSINNEQM